MTHRRRRIAVLIGLVACVGVGLAPAAQAQNGKEVAKSLCAAFSKAEVRGAFRVAMDSHADPSFQQCTWGTTDIGDTELYLNLGWLNITFEDLVAVQPDGLAMTVGGHPARFDPVSQTLNLDLDQGVLVLGVQEPYGSSDWEAALTGLGELAVERAADLQAPPPPDPTLVALFPAVVDGVDLLLQAAYVDKEFPSGRDPRGKALRSALKAAGKGLADVSLAMGQFPDLAAYLAALKVQDADAAEFAEAAATWSMLTGWTAVPEAFVNGAVNAVSFGDGAYTRYVYPKDDVVWIIDAQEPQLSQIFAALPGAPTLPVAEEPIEEPVIDEPVVGPTCGSIRDLLPTSLGGEDLMTQFVDGSGGGFSDPGTKVNKALRAGLDAEGKTIEDVTLGAAQTSDGSAGAIGIEVDGADATAFVDFAIEQVLSGMPSRKHEKEPGEVGGKAVTVLRPARAMGRVIYIYPQGDIVWIVSATDEASLEELFAALP